MDWGLFLTLVFQALILLVLIAVGVALFAAIRKEVRK